MTPLPWRFEPCSPEGALDLTNIPWPHAVRGRREAGRLVIGYGHTEPHAEQDARDAAQHFDANEVLGERGEPTYRMEVTTGWTELVNTANDGGYLIPPGMPMSLIEELKRFGGLS